MLQAAAEVLQAAKNSLASEQRKDHAPTSILEAMAAAAHVDPTTAGMLTHVLVYTLALQLEHHYAQKILTLRRTVTIKGLASHRHSNLPKAQRHRLPHVNSGLPAL